jgi:hypothetical protein
MDDNPEKKMMMNASFYEYESVTYEEKTLKSHMAQELGIQYNQTGLRNALFYNNRLPLDVMQQLRLSFLTSQTLIENGGASYLNGKDFREAIDQRSELMAFDFLIENFEKNLDQMKP